MAMTTVGATAAASLLRRATARSFFSSRQLPHLSFASSSSRPLKCTFTRATSSRFCSTAFTSANDPQSAPISAPASSSAVAVEEAPPVAQAEEPQLDALDIRVGRIVKAWKHPDADSLYVEEVDLGEDTGPRTICSGLVKYVPEDELQGRDVVVLANLKPRNMKGIKSNGMLLAASDAAHENVELIIPPDGSQPGERIWFGSDSDQPNQAPPATPNQLTKKKIWEALQPKLKTADDLTVYFEEKPMRTSAGLVTSKTLARANVS